MCNCNPVGSEAIVNSKYAISNCAEVAAKVGISELMLPFSDKHIAKLVIYLPKTNHVAVRRHEESILCSVTGAGPCYFYRTESSERLPFCRSFSPPGLLRALPISSHDC